MSAAMGSIQQAIHDAIVAAIDQAAVAVSGEGGHFNIEVTATAFEGLGTLERHRLVLSAIKDLMAGENAPVHAVDSLKTRVS